MSATHLANVFETRSQAYRVQVRLNRQTYQKWFSFAHGQTRAQALVAALLWRDQLQGELPRRGDGSRRRAARTATPRRGAASGCIA
jgi:hypothetical protein